MSSSLLQNVLASRLAQATLNGEPSQEADVKEGNHESQQAQDSAGGEVGDETLRPREERVDSARGASGGTGLGSDDWEMVTGGEGRSSNHEDAGALSDEELVGEWLLLPGRTYKGLTTYHIDQASSHCPGRFQAHPKSAGLPPQARLPE